MKLPKELTTVTPLSKTLAFIVFITLPFIGFLAGIRYQQAVSPVQTLEVTMDSSRSMELLSPKPSLSPVISSTTVTVPVLKDGTSLENIKYTLPPGWTGNVVSNVGPNRNEKALIISAPSSSGGILSIFSYSYNGTTGRREFYCNLRKVCIKETAFKPMKIGNLSGYEATSLDNSGGGSEMFTAEGNKFYILYFTRPSYCPNNSCEFDSHQNEVVNSLTF